LEQLKNLSAGFMADSSEMAQLEHDVSEAMGHLEVGIKGNVVKVQVQNLIQSMRQEALNLPYLM